MKELTKAHIKAILHSIFNFHEIWYVTTKIGETTCIYCDDCDKLFYGEK